MVSKIAHRNKLVGSRRKMNAGNEGPKVEASGDTASIERLKAESKEEGGLKKVSDQLRMAALEQLKLLKEYGTSEPFAINIDKSTDKDENGDSKNKLEDQFYKRCDASTNLVNKMEENLAVEREANLLALVAAEEALQKQKKSAVKSQAALNFLKKKHEHFKKLNGDLESLKLEIAELVRRANTLNESCTTELDDTINKDLQSTIQKKLNEMNEEGTAIRDRLEELLKSIDGEPAVAKVDAAAAPSADAAQSADAAGKKPNAEEGAAEGAAQGGRYRRSRNRNLRKRRSFHLKRRGGGCNGHDDADSCDDDDDCMWNRYTQRCMPIH